jgi:hypothetical protein
MRHAGRDALHHPNLLRGSRNFPRDMGRLKAPRHPDIIFALLIASGESTRAPRTVVARKQTARARESAVAARGQRLERMRESQTFTL